MFMMMATSHQSNSYTAKNSCSYVGRIVMFACMIWPQW